MISHSVSCHPAEVTFPPLPQTIKDGTQFSNTLERYKAEVVAGVYCWAKLGWNWCRNYHCYTILSLLRNTREAPWGSLCENMALSTKREVHNVLQRHKRRTKPWPQAANTENFVKLRRVVIEIPMQTDRQTDRLITILCISLGVK